jgi:hypothetical protein
LRARNLKPGFFKNEDLARLGPYGQILFEGLWCLADREGRLEDRPLRIKAEVFPYYDPKPNVMTLLDKLVQGHFIQRYQVNGTAYLKICKFLQHQNPHPHEAGSKIPDPQNINDVDVMKCSLHSMTSQGLSPECNADSLNPSSLNPDTPPSPSRSMGENGDGFFKKFWLVYPRKKNKGDAEKAFKKIHPNEELITRILASIERAKKSKEWLKEDGAFIPYPASWLNAKGWEDEYPGQLPAGEKPPPVEYIDRDGTKKEWRV